jgi:hypothetical protein
MNKADLSTYSKASAKKVHGEVGTGEAFSGKKEAIFLRRRNARPHCSLNTVIQGAQAPFGSLSPRPQPKFQKRHVVLASAIGYFFARARSTLQIIGRALREMVLQIGP